MKIHIYIYVATTDSICYAYQETISIYIYDIYGVELMQGCVLADFARISSRHEWIRYQALYSYLKI